MFLGRGVGCCGNVLTVGESSGQDFKHFYFSAFLKKNYNIRRPGKRKAGEKITV